jgi:hypothetical protein
VEGLETCRSCLATRYGRGSARFRAPDNCKRSLGSRQRVLQLVVVRWDNDREPRFSDAVMAGSGSMPTVTGKPISTVHQAGALSCKFP